MNRIFRYLQSTKENGLVCNPYRKLVVVFYSDADFVGPWGHENPQDPISDKRRNGFLVTFFNCPLFQVSKL